MTTGRYPWHSCDGVRTAVPGSVAFHASKLPHGDCVSTSTSSVSLADIGGQIFCDSFLSVDRPTMLAAVKENPLALQRGGEYANDLEIVMTALASAGWSKFYSAPELRSVHEIVRMDSSDHEEKDDSEEAPLSPDGRGPPNIYSNVGSFTMDTPSQESLRHLAVTHGAYAPFETWHHPAHPATVPTVAPGCVCI